MSHSLRASLPHQLGIQVPLAHVSSGDPGVFDAVLVEGVTFVRNPNMWLFSLWQKNCAPPPDLGLWVNKEGAPPRISGSISLRNGCPLGAEADPPKKPNFFGEPGSSMGIVIVIESFESFVWSVYMAAICAPAYTMCAPGLFDTKIVGGIRLC